MLSASSDQILTRLAQIPGVKTAEPFLGDPEALLKQAKQLPALYLVYAGANFADGPVAAGALEVDTAQGWTVMLLSKNLRSRADGALEAYALVAEVHQALRKFPVAGGWLWPLREGLIFAEAGVLCYGIDFRLDTET